MKRGLITTETTSNGMTANQQPPNQSAGSYVVQDNNNLSKQSQEQLAQHSASSQQQHLRLEQQQFKEIYAKALEKGVIDLGSSQHAQVMIAAMKKKVRSAKEKAFIQSAVSRIGVFSHHPLIFQQESSTILLFREIQYTLALKRDVIFKQGDIGDTYYMIITGEVYCLVPTSKNQEKQQEPSNTLKKKTKIIQKNATSGCSMLQDKDVNPLENDKMLDLTDEQFLEKRFPSFKMVKIFKGWEGFGDIALITQQYRTATMVCKEDTHLICLTKSGFDKIIGEVSRQQKLSQVKFLKQFPFFSSIPKSKLMSILMDIEIIRFPKNTMLFEEGEPIAQVFFVFEGEVAISKKHIVQRIDVNLLQPDLENCMRKSSSILREGLSNTRRICLSIIGSNSYCGVDDLLNGKSLREFSAECISTTSIIYQLSKDKFLDYLKVYRQFEKNSDACISKDEMNNQRSQDIADYIDNCYSKTQGRQVFTGEEIQENPPERAIQPKTIPREIIKDRALLGKELASANQFLVRRKNSLDYRQPDRLQKIDDPLIKMNTNHNHVKSENPSQSYYFNVNPTGLQRKQLMLEDTEDDNDNQNMPSPERKDHNKQVLVNLSVESSENRLTKINTTAAITNANKDDSQPEQSSIQQQQPSNNSKKSSSNQNICKTSMLQQKNDKSVNSDTDKVSLLQMHFKEENKLIQEKQHSLSSSRINFWKNSTGQQQQQQTHLFSKEQQPSSSIPFHLLHSQSMKSSLLADSNQNDNNSQRTQASNQKLQSPSSSNHKSFTYPVPHRDPYFSDALEKRVNYCELVNFEKIRDFSYLKSNQTLKTILSEKYCQRQNCLSEAAQVQTLKNTSSSHTNKSIMNQLSGKNEHYPQLTPNESSTRQLSSCFQAQRVETEQPQSNQTKKEFVRLEYLFQMQKKTRELKEGFKNKSSQGTTGFQIANNLSKSEYPSSQQQSQSQSPNKRNKNMHNNVSGIFTQQSLNNCSSNNCSQISLKGRKKAATHFFEELLEKRNIATLPATKNDTPSDSSFGEDILMRKMNNIEKNLNYYSSFNNINLNNYSPIQLKSFNRSPLNSSIRLLESQSPEQISLGSSLEKFFLSKNYSTTKNSSRKDYSLLSSPQATVPSLELSSRYDQVIEENQLKYNISNGKDTLTLRKSTQQSFFQKYKQSQIQA